ncbi:MAG: sensor histidine kinase, partial [Bacteroidota bacterium]
PRFLTNKKYWLYLLSLVLISLIWPPISISLDNIIDREFFKTSEDNLDDPLSPIGHVLIFIVLLISSLVNMAYRWLVESEKTKSLEVEKVNEELDFLKHQISPHFFFNTLNNLYSLALDKSDQTPEVILKLSELMRYSLYECKDKYVPLENEVQYLKNYIEILQIRQKDQFEVSFNPNIDGRDIKVAPLLLIIFVENAFKYGIKSTKKDSDIGIKLDANHQYIHFNIWNFREKDSKINEGIGLQNVKKRLDLLYQDRYQLDISHTDHEFEVTLKLTL